MANQQKYFIGPSLLSDIRSTIQRVDAIAPRTSGPAQEVRLQGLQQPMDGLRLQRGTFTGSWAVGETKAVTIQGGTQTISVTNYCVPVSANTASTQTYNVIFGAVMGTQTAVEVQAGGMQTGTTSGPWNKDTTATINGVSGIRNYWGNVASGKRVGFQMAADGHYYLVVAEC